MNKGDWVATLNDKEQPYWVYKIKETVEWEEALQYCENLVFAGHDDWKLPSNKEQVSMVDYRKMKPALDETFFPNTDYKAFYWSPRTPRVVL